METDVVVAGIGMAGAAAALACAESGCRVTALEADAVVGGNARFAETSVWAVSDPAAYRSEDRGANHTLIERISRSITDDLQWIGKYGYTTQLEPLQITTGGGTPALAYLLTGRSDDRWSALAAAMRDAGVDVRTQSRVASVDYRAGASHPWQVAVSTDRTPLELRARAVILAMGSYPASADMWRAHLASAAEHLVARTTRHCDGASLNIAKALGLDLDGRFERFYGHLVPYGVALEPADFTTYALAISDQGMLLTTDGALLNERPAADSISAELVAHRADGLAYLILSRAVFETGVAGIAASHASRTLTAIDDGRIPSAQGSLSAVTSKLAAITGVATAPSAQAAEESLAAFNAVAESDGRQPLTPPFVGVAVVPGMTFGKGGLHVDEQLRPTRGGTTFDPTLFAAGTDIGGIYDESYGGGLAAALVTGRLAGQHAAAAIASA